MILMLNKKLDDKEQYRKNLKRLEECLEFERNRLNIKIEPGSKLDVLDINNLKWYKGEIIKRTNIAWKEKLGFGIESDKSTALLYIEYKIDGSKNIGYYKADSILLAPEGYFTSEDPFSSGFEDRFLDSNFLASNDSPARFMRVITRLNRLLHNANLN